ncbi:hypothetical protein KKI24_09690 [bacterium]|nr:hypothetical protein [bacterium]
MTIPKEHKIIAVAQFITIAGLVGFWTTFYLFPSVIRSTKAYQFKFDVPFPLPDIILGIALFLAGYSLLKGRGKGRILTLICALYLIYLGIIDIGIPYGSSVIAVSVIDIIANGGVNLWCVVLGLYSILKLRKHHPEG